MDAALPSVSDLLAAQDAAQALIALGLPVRPHGPDMDAWIIGNLIWTDEELMGLAARQAINPAERPRAPNIRSA